MEITAAMVRDLREKTGLPMMECKKALTEASGDMDEALAWLKKNASGKMSKMASRETSQGRVACHVTPDGTRAGIVELLCETAPVANTDDFANLAAQIAKTVAGVDDPTPESILQQPSADDPSTTLDDLKSDVFSRLRENMNVKRVGSLQGHVASYAHHNAQVGVIVAFSAPCPEELANGVCMHIAAMNPPALKRAEVDPKTVAEQKAEFEAEAAGKPPEIAEKIVTGKLDRFYSEIVLLEQPFVKDDKKSVTQALQEADSGLTINAFLRYQVGAV
jgi:elongation factor Ts